jgi:Protein of unknown function (DUF2628)
VDDATDAELAAVFRPRSEYYLAQWRGTSHRGYNWAAFLLSGAWLPFRRLYLVTAIFYGVVVLETVIEEVLFWWFGYREVPPVVDRIVALAFAGACGSMGNRWYLARVRRIISETRALGLAPDEHLQALSRRGGTRLWHALGFFALFLVLVVGGEVLVSLLRGE